MGVKRIVPNFRAPDPQLTRRFYEEVIGLEVVMDQGWIVTLAAPDPNGPGAADPNGPGAADPDGPGAAGPDGPGRADPAAPQISLISKDATAPVVANVSIEVEDVDAVHARAKEFGSEIVHPLTDEEWGVRRFFLKDPDGQVVNVLSHQ